MMMSNICSILICWLTKYEDNIKKKEFRISSALKNTVLKKYKSQLFIFIFHAN